MQIITNSRQVPKEKTIILNNGYCDVIYGYLQIISQWDGDKSSLRYIPKRGFTMTGAADDCGVSRATFSKYFKAMLDTPENVTAGNPILLKEKSDRYELLVLDQTLAMLVPYKTLVALVSALNSRAISIYVYLLNRYLATLASGSKTFVFTIDSLKAVVGLSNKNRGKSNEVIKGILTVLHKLGLLQWKEVTESIDGAPRTYCIVTYMTNDIDESKVVFENEESRSLFDKLKGVA